MVTDPGEGNDQFWWSNHIDRRLANIPYGLMEMNWYHYMTNGHSGVPGLGGLDLYNLGLGGIAGTNVLTAAWGLKYKPSVNSEVGVCLEVPLTMHGDIVDERTFDRRPDPAVLSLVDGQFCAPHFFSPGHFGHGRKCLAPQAFCRKM